MDSNQIIYQSLHFFTFKVSKKTILSINGIFKNLLDAEYKYFNWITKDPICLGGVYLNFFEGIKTDALSRI